MSETVEHSPLPWSIGGTDTEGLWISQPDGNENVICDLIGRKYGEPYTDEDYANAALIVEAVNAHDSQKETIRELVQALINTRLAIETLPEGALGREPHLGHYYAAELLSQIDAALARAKGE